MTTTDHLIKGAKKLIDSVEFDMNGRDGRDGKGGNGGLTSDQTIKAAGELRVIISRLGKEEEERA